MSDFVDLSNPAVRRLREYIKVTFTQAPKDFFKDIILSTDAIIKANNIDITKVLQPKNYGKGNYTVEDRVKQLRNKDKGKLRDNFLLDQITIDIIKILHSYKLRQSRPQKAANTRGYEYKDATEDPFDDDLIIPDENTDLSSVKLNLFYNKDVQYKFTDRITIQELNKSSSSLQTLHLKINGVLEHTLISIKRKAICTNKTNGVECGNVVHFSDVHLNSQIRCTDSKITTKEGHVIRKLEKAIVEENCVWYVYEGADLKNENSTELKICSLQEINANDVIANAIFVNDDSSNYVLILSIKEREVKLLKERILLKDEKSLHFLDDIYKSLQKYLVNYHNIILTNQNKIVGEIITFILLNNLFYNKRMNALIVGKSGSGKTIWSEWLIPLFTLNSKTILGTDVTRNKFVGGRSNTISSSVNSLFSAGYVATQNVIFAEECTNSLKDFKDTKLNQANNIFHLVKSCSGREIDVAIQGGQKVYPKASCILVGNLEQLDFTSSYKQYVANKYKKLGDNIKKSYKERWPLFKPVGYYIETLKNMELAEAHSIIRQNYKDIAGNHFVTRLPPAELARYAFMIILEDDLNDKKNKRIMKKDEILVNPKREQLIKEFNEIFINEDGIVECPFELKEQINDFYNDEFYPGRHNYKNIFGAEREINSHIENNIITIMEQLVWMNKLYYKNPDHNLTDDDKMIIKDFMLYNYNTISSEEARLIRRPFINDFAGLKEDAINTELDSKNEYFERKRIAKEKDDAELLSMVEDGEGENLL